MAKADPPKKRKPKVGAAAGVGASSGALYGAKQFVKGFVPYNVEPFHSKPTKVPRTVSYMHEGRKFSYIDEAIQRVSGTKFYSKFAVVTQSTKTETLGGMRTGARSTTISPTSKTISKLNKLGINPGQLIIQERKPPEPDGKPRVDKKGRTQGRYAAQGGKGTGAGKYVYDTASYAGQGTKPTGIGGKIPKGGRAALNLVGTAVNVKKDAKWVEAISAGSKAGQYIKSRTPSELLGTATKVAKGASKLVGAANVVGAGFLAYDTGRAIQEYAGSEHHKKQMKKYKEQGGYSATYDGGY